METGQSFGQYTVLASLATSGSDESVRASSVPDPLIAQWAAEAGFARLVVIKPLFSDGEQSKYSRFLDSTKKAASLHHPNVRQIHELGAAEGDFYVAVEYLEGITFDTLLRARARAEALADPRLYCALLAQACEGIHHAHVRLRLLHGSLRPDKLFVTSGGTIKLLGLGLGELQNATADPAKLADAARYAYLSPEQILGRKTDERTDVFSLGIIAWEALTGRRLFSRATRVEVYRAITEKPIPSPRALAPSVPQALDRAVSRALSADPNDRYKSARDFGLALEEGVGELGPPLSTVATASLIDRCFSQELELQRTTVQRARQRLAAPESEEDIFEVPTRLYEGGFEANDTAKISSDTLAELLATGTAPSADSPSESPAPGASANGHRRAHYGVQHRKQPAHPVDIDTDIDIDSDMDDIEIDVEPPDPPNPAAAPEPSESPRVHSPPPSASPFVREFERPPETLSELSAATEASAVGAASEPLAPQAFSASSESLAAPVSPFAEPAQPAQPASDATAAAAETAKASGQAAKTAAKTKPKIGRLILAAVVIFALSAGAAYGYQYLTRPDAPAPTPVSVE